MTTLVPSFLNLAGNKDFHKSLNEFDFALERQKYNRIML